MDVAPLPKSNVLGVCIRTGRLTRLGVIHRVWLEVFLGVGHDLINVLVKAFKKSFPCGEIDFVHAANYCFLLVGLRITKPRNSERGVEHFVPNRIM